MSLPTDRLGRRRDGRYFHRHPVFGDIPLIATEYLDPAGKLRSSLDWDLDYRPALPRGAVRGNVRKQNLCFAHNVPMYFFVDHTMKCIQCGGPFKFSAREQKYWYESLGFYGLPP
jgi:hypothetical protein